MILSHGTKSATLQVDGKRYATASKTKRFQTAKRDFSLFWMSQCVACHPAGQILYHVTVSCKGPIMVPEKPQQGSVNEVSKSYRMVSYSIVS